MVTQFKLVFMGIFNHFYVSFLYMNVSITASLRCCSPHWGAFSSGKWWLNGCRAELQLQQALMWDQVVSPAEVPWRQNWQTQHLLKAVGLLLAAVLPHTHQHTHTVWTFPSTNLIQIESARLLVPQEQTDKMSFTVWREALWRSRSIEASRAPVGVN